MATKRERIKQNLSKSAWTWKIHPKSHSSNLFTLKKLYIYFTFIFCFHFCFPLLKGTLSGRLSSFFSAFFSYHSLPHVINAFICQTELKGMKVKRRDERNENENENKNVMKRSSPIAIRGNKNCIFHFYWRRFTYFIMANISYSLHMETPFRSQIYFN